MANYRSTRDLKMAVLQNAGEPTDGSSHFDALAVTYLNKFYLGSHAGSSVFNIDCNGAWTWAKADFDGSLIIYPPYKDGMIQVVNGQDWGTFTIPPDPSTDIVGMLLVAQSDNESYRIIRAEAGNSIVYFDSPYISNTEEKSFSLIKDQYDLRPNGEQKILRLVDGFSVQSVSRNYGIAAYNGKINLVDERKLNEYLGFRYPKCGWPTMAAEIKDRDGLKTIRFSHYVSHPTKVTYPYIPIPNDLVDSDEDIPRLPREFRDFLEAAATYKLLTDKDDSRASDYAAMANATLKSLVKAENVERQFTSSRRGELIPRGNQVSFRTRWF